MMTKLLIAVHSEVISDDLISRLHNHFEVCCCHNGTDALRLLNDFRPDVLVIDLMLSDFDGITVIKTVNSAGIFPKVVALTDYISSYIADSLEKLDVCSVFRYSSNLLSVAARIIEISTHEEVTCIQAIIRNTVAMLGFNMNNSGTSITEIAIEMYMHDPGQKLSYQLYPSIAAVCGGTPVQVERAIRASVESAWKNGNEEVWRLYFSVAKNGKVSKPTNADFLARISWCIENMSNRFEQKRIAKEKIG